MSRNRPGGAIGGYFPYSFPRSRDGFFRACVFFDQVELFLPNPIDGLLVPRYDQKHLKAGFEAFNRFLLEIKPLVEAEVVTPVTPGRPDGFVGHSLYGEQFWWELADAPFEAEALSDSAKTARFKQWWPVVADMNTEEAIVPYTDDPAAHRWFADRLGDLRSDAAEMAGAWDELAVGSSWLGLETLRVEAPHLTPQTPEQVLEIRERLASELLGFRVEIERLGATIATTPWEPAFSREVARLIAGDVAPTLRELQRRSVDLRKEVRWKSLSAVVQATPLPILTTILVGVPIELGLALAGGVALADVMEEYRRVGAQLKQNGLSLLLADLP